MRVFAALAIAGLTFCVVALPADAQTKISGVSPVTVLDLSITNNGPVTSACPISLKLLAHVKNPDTKPVPISYVFEIDGVASTPQFASIAAQSTQAVSGTVQLTIKTGQPTLKSRVSIHINDGNLSPSFVGAFAKGVAFTALCPILTPGVIESGTTVEKI
jgi:hypothetical protein